MKCEVLRDCEIFAHADYGGDRVIAGRNNKGQIKYCQSSNICGCVKHTILSPEYLYVLALLLEKDGLPAIRASFPPL